VYPKSKKPKSNKSKKLISLSQEITPLKREVREWEKAIDIGELNKERELRIEYDKKEEEKARAEIKKNADEKAHKVIEDALVDLYHQTVMKNANKPDLALTHGNGRKRVKKNGLKNKSRKSKKSKSKKSKKLMTSAALLAISKVYRNEAKKAMKKRK